MERIEKLTPEQTALLPVWADKWTQIGLSTEPMDRDRAEKAIKLAYQAAGLPKPHIVFGTSPMAGAIWFSIMNDPELLPKLGVEIGNSVRASVGASVWASVRASVGASVWDSVWDSVWASVRDSVRASVGASVWDSVWDSVRDSVWASVRDSVRASVGDSVRASVGASVRASVGASVWDSVWASVRDSVWASVGASVWASVRDSVRASVGDSVRASVGASVWDSVWASVRDSVRDSVGASVWDSVWDSVWKAGYGQHDANWIAFYHFFRENCALVEQTERLVGLIELTQSAGWFWPMEKVCLVTDRPQYLARDDQGRLHCEDRAAIEYRDGWGVYSWHGVRVPDWIILHPERITVELIDAERNAEVRRVMMERFGFDKYLLAGKAEILDHEEGVGTLYRKEIPDDEPLVMVSVINSTPEPDGSWKRYTLRVHPECRPLLADQELGEPQKLTARNAIASTFGLKGSQYYPQIET